MFDEGYSIFLLFSQSINVGKKEGYIMTTNQHHDSTIIKFLHVGLGVGTRASNMRRFAIINSVIQKRRLAWLWQLAAYILNMLATGIHKGLWKYIFRSIEGWAVAATLEVMMVEVAVNANMYVTTPQKV
ncbi:hypothetical protein C0991_003005 [Blastosporella zonata]|nr:hypothetical protein C0991_003005 [Blastosporella zonata]